ncbi:MAG: stalk domain-containing protein [Acidobacteriota bacterium]
MKGFLKTLLPPMVIVVLVLSMVCSIAPNAYPATSLVAQYKFNSDFKDSAGNGNDGAQVGDVSIVDDKVMGKCALFNGGYISVKSSPMLNPESQFTISAWVMVDPSMAVPNNKSGPIISKLDDAGNYNNYILFTKGTYGVRSNLRTNAGDKLIDIGPFKDYHLANGWSHLIFSGDGQNLYLYHNGALIATKNVGSNVSINSSTGDLRIGNGSDINNKNMLFKGRMADLRIYNGILSPEEIKSLYNSGNPNKTEPPKIVPQTQPVISSAKTPIVLINGQPLVSDVKPMVNKDGRIMLPLRSIAQALGAQVDWNAPTKTATLYQGTNTIKVTLGQKTLMVNGRLVPMDTVAVSQNGCTLLPVRSVGEAFGSKIGWDPATKTVSITSEGPSITPQVVDKAAQFPDAMVIKHTRILPDLEIVNCFTDPSIPKYGDKVTFKVTILNRGDDTATFKLGYPLLEMKNAAGYGVESYPSDVTIEPGKSIVSSLFWEPKEYKSGVYQPTIVVDPQNVVIETNEDNNSKSLNVEILSDTPQTSADLVITNIELTDPNPTSKYDFKARVTVKNQGTAKAVIPKDKSIISCSGVQFVQYGGSADFELEPGQTQTFEIAHNPNSSFDVGNVTWTFAVDPYNACIEADEANNTKVFSKNITLQSGPLPDLEIVNCYITPSNPKNGDFGRLNIVFKNVGTVAISKDFSIGCNWNNGWQWIYVNNTTINPGDTLTKTLDMGTLSYKSYPYTIQIKVDSAQLIVESNETNNSVELTFSVTQ